MAPQKLGERKAIGKFATRPPERNAQRRRGYEGGRIQHTGRETAHNSTKGKNW